MDSNFTHLHPCKHCPSYWYPKDPLSEDMFKNWTREEVENEAFDCAWRPGGYCMGYMFQIYEEFGTSDL